MLDKYEREEKVQSIVKQKDFEYIIKADKQIDQLQQQSLLYQKKYESKD